MSYLIGLLLIAACLFAIRRMTKGYKRKSIVTFIAFPFLIALTVINAALSKPPFSTAWWLVVAIWGVLLINTIISYVHWKKHPPLEEDDETTETEAVSETESKTETETTA